MKQILVIHDGVEILIWLTGEPVESAGKHIESGYPEFASRWSAGELSAVSIEVAAADEFNPERFEVAGEVIQRKP